jgi:hypothetical protein
MLYGRHYLKSKVHECYFPQVKQMVIATLMESQVELTDELVEVILDRVSS